MKMQEVREQAKQWGVDAKIGRTKAAIIRDIQIAEGNAPCFATIPDCGETICLWYEDCTKAS